MVDEYQDTNRPQYLLVRRLAERHRNLCVVGDPDQSIYKWRGADLKNILDFERDFPDTYIVRLERNYRSTQMILDAASAVISQNRNRKDKRLWTDRKGGAKILYFRGGDELEEADFIMRSTRRALSEDPEHLVAVLYRTNAQSRAIEDALMRAGMAYRVVGGVRFYERREVKDSLAYLKVIINPHDDVSLRRIINVPARGIGKGVLDGLESLPPPAEPPPLFSAGLDPTTSVNSMWTRLLRAIDERLLPSRAIASLAAFRDLIVALTDVARRDPVSIAVGKMLDQSGYLADLREERSEEAEGRIENLMELVSAAREYENRDPEASIGGFVDQLSLLSDIDEAQGSVDARTWLMTMHSAKGAGVPGGVHRGPGGRPVPALAVARGRGGAGGGTASVLRRDDSRAHAPGAHERRAPARVRRLPADRALTLPRGDSAGADRAGARDSHRHQGSLHQHYEFRTDPYGRGSRTGRPAQAARGRSAPAVPLRGGRPVLVAGAQARRARAARAVRPRHGGQCGARSTTTRGWSSGSRSVRRLCAPSSQSWRWALTQEARMSA